MFSTGNELKSQTVAEIRSKNGYVIAAVSPMRQNLTVPVKKKSLAETHPTLAKEADGWDPADFTFGSSNNLPWKCSLGHSWNAKISSRSHFNSGCPICSNAKILKGFNDLATVNPTLAKEADGWDPTSLGAGSNKKLAWKCSEGHEWLAIVANRNKGVGCPYCKGSKLLKGFNDLATTHPEIAAQAHGWDPTEYIGGSNKKFNWICEKGHVYETWISERKIGNGCPFCSGRRVLKGFNDLGTLLPQLAKEAYGWDPSEITIGKNKRLDWKCQKGHVYKQTPSRRRAGSDCPYCSNSLVLPGLNDLATTHPELAAQAYGWDPKSVMAGSDQQLEWICSIGHVWKMRVADRKGGDGCFYCSGHRVLTGFNDLATTHPEIAKQASGWDPTKVNAGSNKKLAWKCSEGHEWLAIVANRTWRNDGCVFCSNREVLAGYNDLRTTHPNLADSAIGWDPSKYTAGSGKKQRWKCDEGHEWLATIGSRTNMESGCPSCAKSGFDPNKQGWLYFLYHEIWDMYQIGITNFPEDRLKSHKRLGWTVLEIRGPLDGHVTQIWETEMLRSLKRNGALLATTEIAGKFDGFSESWTKSSFQASGLWQLMQLVEKDESSKN